MFRDFSDNALRLAVFIGLYLSYGALFEQLYAIKEETRTTKEAPSSPKPRELDADAEDQIETDTLYALSKSPNYDLQNAAVKILVDRAARPAVRQLLLKDLRSRNSDKRQKAIEGLVYLLHGVDLDDSERAERRRTELVQSKETIQSLVTALVNIQSEQRHAKEREQHKKDKGAAKLPAVKLPPSPIRPLTRSPQENKALGVLIYILGYSKSASIDPIDTALQAGLVSQWLANYPFPCTLPQYGGGNYKKSDVVSLFESRAYETDDVMMSGLMGLLTKNAKAMKQLRNAGLTTSSFKEDSKVYCRTGQWKTVDTAMSDVPAAMSVNVDEEGVTGRERLWAALDTAMAEAAAASANGPRMRSVERSQEENRLRRRHREAIVVAERDEPLSRENILQRQDSDVPVSSMHALGGHETEEDEDGDDKDEENEDGDDEDDAGRSPPSSSGDSMPDLEDVPPSTHATGPVNRRLSGGGSPTSFRQRVIERQQPTGGGGGGLFPRSRYDDW